VLLRNSAIRENIGNQHPGEKQGEPFCRQKDEVDTAPAFTDGNKVRPRAEALLRAKTDGRKTENVGAKQR